MLTGDASINPQAPIICCTAEVLANMALCDEQASHIHCAVLDEFHYYTDLHRGMAWQIPLLRLPHASLLLMSATLGDPFDLKAKFKATTQIPIKVVASATRPVPLDFEYSEKPLHETLQELLSSKKSPIYVVQFTQRTCVMEAQNLTSFDLCSRQHKQDIAQALKDFPFDTPFGKQMKRFVSHGIGLHHAGLLPKYRLLTEKLAQKGLIQVVIGTDTLGVGVNIPIRTVLLSQLCKFDGVRMGILTGRDFHQISGRAGRKGFDDAGSVVCQAPAHVIENKRAQARFAAGKSNKKPVKKQAPPPSRYAPWDKATFERLVHKQEEPLRSQFAPSYPMLFQLLHNAPESLGVGYAQLLQLIEKSHETPHAKNKHRRSAASLFRALRGANIICKHTEETTGKTKWALSSNLPEGFSLHESLSLYLLATLPELDPNHPEYALGVLSLVEATLENPAVILKHQVDQLKQRKLAELKAEGVEYEERMRQLEEIQHPKPMADFIYSTFNAFTHTHPWVCQDNIRPKSIARDMWEHCSSFNEYVNEYGLQRCEGILLRSLCNVYKALTQIVPQQYKTESVLEVEAFIKDFIHHTDKSLITEWEQLNSLTQQEPGKMKLQQAKIPPPITVNPQALRAQLRSQLYQLVTHLARKQYKQALALLCPNAEHPWTEETLEQTLKEYYTQYDHMVCDPRIRLPQYTLIKPQGPNLWQVQQVLLDPQGDNQWALEGFVSLQPPPQPGQPVFCLQRLLK